jgi:type IV secretory pathway TrbD component
MAADDDDFDARGADPRTLALSDGVFAIALTLLIALALGLAGLCLWCIRHRLS